MKNEHGSASERNAVRYSSDGESRSGRAGIDGTPRDLGKWLYYAMPRSASMHASHARRGGLVTRNSITPDSVALWNCLGRAR